MRDLSIPPVGFSSIIDLEPATLIERLDGSAITIIRSEITMNLKCEKYVVKGLVQGVGFRYQTSHQGLKLGLTGYAKNLNNGDVEVVACGTETQIDEFTEWLKEGPRTATVESVSHENASYKPYRGFKIL
jgi:acylphosphatase